MLPDDLRGQRIGIFGFGVNNRALTAWLVSHGAADLVVVDEWPQAEQQVREAGLGVAVVAGAGAFDRPGTLDVIFRTPGMRPDHPALVRYREQGARISSQTDLFLQLCPARTIGVTGTKGKGTTASLLAHLLEGRGQGRVFLAGNIGKDPFEFLDELQANDVVVLELSSGQLVDAQHSPNLAIVLDITADHLDYHATLGEYVDAKRNIVRHQQPGDVSLLNLDSQAASSFALDAGGTTLYYSVRKSVDAGGFIADDKVYYRDPRSAGAVEVVSVDELPLPGSHSQVNALAAITAAAMLGMEPGEICAQLKTFRGLPHRLETVGTKGGVKWVNDSYATVPDATIAALESFSEPLVLIVGGSTKGLDWHELGRMIAQRSPKALLAIGQTGPEIADAAQRAGLAVDRIAIVDGLPAAVTRASAIAVDGDVVLLSPASTSFGEFQNATERGNQFRSLVEGLGE